MDHRKNSENGPFGEKIFAVAGVLSGFALLAFELKSPGASASGIERGFWIVVGVLVIVFGAIELAQRSGDER